MKRILRKRILLVIGVVIVFFVFLIFTMQQEQLVSLEVSKDVTEMQRQNEQEDQIAPVSRIVAPRQGITIGRSFQIKVQEADTGGSGLLQDECRYSVYDCSSISCIPTVFNAKRPCNDSFWVSVGKDQSCFSEGKATCRIVVHSKDYAGNSNSLSENQESIKTFGVDLISPEVFLEQPSLTRATLSVSFEGKVRDNVEVSNCQMVVDKKGQYSSSPLVFASISCAREGEGACYSVSGSHTFVSSGTYDISLSCWDLAGNTGRSKSYAMEVVKNRIPQISSCRVVPPSGSLSTSFLFQVEATDPDQDSLNYQWDFGDGTLLPGKEVFYEYSKPGVYRPEVRVQDSFKTEARCSTAWVTVE